MSAFDPARLNRGRIEGHLLRMSATMLANMLAGAVFALVNLYWLGLLGAEAQAAAMLAAYPAMLLMALMPVIATGAGILIAQAMGAGDRAQAERIFNEAFAATLLFMGAIGLAAWAGRDAIAVLLTADARTAAAMIAYLDWFIPSLVIQLPLLVIANALEFTGDVRTAAIAQTSTVALSALLAPLLMFGGFGIPAMGIAGAGLATFLGCAVVMLVLMRAVLRGGAGLRLRPAFWVSRPRTLRRAVGIGLPAGLESALMAIGLLALALALRPFGADEQAAFGIGQRVLQIVGLPLSALAGATAILVGHGYGAGLGERVRGTLRAGLILALALATAILLALAIFAPRIVGGFSDDPGVIAAGTGFLRIAAIAVVPGAFCAIVFATLGGMGDTRAGLFGEIAHTAVIAIAAVVLVRLAGFEAIWLWLAMLGAAAAQTAVALRCLREVHRRSRRSLEPLPDGVAAMP
jgi:putative MATE family efflux protein